MGTHHSKYSALAQELRGQIESGTLPPGSKIPSEPRLAQQHGLSRHTVRQAISVLEREGLLQRIQGSGTYVSQGWPLARSSGSRTVGVISTFWDNYIFSSIVKGINDQLSQAGYSMNLLLSYNSVENERRLLQQVVDSNFEGVIIEPIKSALPRQNRDLYEQIQHTLPCVLINSYYPDLDFPYIIPENTGAAKEAMEYCIRRGHKRFFGIFKSDDLLGHLRYDGYCKALHENRLPFHDKKTIWYTTESFDRIFTGDNGRYILENLKDCTCVFCYNDEVALELLYFLRDQGVKVPEELSVISIDDSLLAVVDVPLTTMAHPKEILGRRAASSLLQLIQDPGAQVTHVFPPTLVERASVRDLNR